MATTATETENATPSSLAGARRVRPWLDIVRLPNLFTAAADVLAGFLFAGGKLDEWTILLRLVIASLCLYAGGVVLNDVVDADQDLRERPHRPIPSGRISRGCALRFAAVLFLAAPIFAAWVSSQALLVVLCIITLVLLYNLWKPTSLAPPVLGLCRALNLLLGMYGMETLLPLPAVRPMGSMFLYVTFLTVFARKEAGVSSHWRLLVGSAGMSGAVMALWGLRWHGYNARFPECRYLAAGLLAVVLSVCLAAIAKPTAARVQIATKSLVLGIIVIDAVIAWNAAGPAAGFAVLCLLVPSMLVARYLRVT